MVRKYLQFKLTKLNQDSKNNDKDRLKYIVSLSKKLEIINTNSRYLEWITTFNWKKTDPYKPKQYII